MPCYSPMTAWRSRSGRNPDTGKWPLVFNRNYGYVDLEEKVPCGRCIGCHLERSRQWAVRIMHEAQMYEDNSFVTLTYDDNHLPEDGSLNKCHFQKFMKRLRKSSDKRIRFYACGEYGKNLSRPHYHAILFGKDFEEKTLYTCRDGIRIYTSEELERIWKDGFSTIGEVTFESAAYVSRYILKKQSGVRGEKYYNGRIPEFTLMSMKPGIGAKWYEKYSKDVFPHDYVIIRGGYKSRVPRFYDNILCDNAENISVKIKAKRRQKQKDETDAETPFKRAAQEKHMLQRTSRLVRPIEK